MGGPSIVKPDSSLKVGVKFVLDQGIWDWLGVIVTSRMETGRDIQARVRW